MPQYFDYRFTCTDLHTAAAGIIALQSAGVIPEGEAPANMLGDRHEVAIGDITLTIRARQGYLAQSWRDPDTGATGELPGAGLPGVWYVALRGTTSPDVLAQYGIDPASFGLSPCTADDSAAVLGVWAG